jgi:hypothetical protein
MTCLPPDEVLAKPNMGKMGELPDGGSKLFQKLINQLGSRFQLGMVCHGQLVVLTAAFKHLNDVFIPCFCGNTM